MPEEPKLKFSIRQYEPSDYERLVQIWESTGITLGASDSIEEINRFWRMNAETFLIAEKGECVIGVVMGGFDGRRGLIHHLAVDPEYQGNGIGSALTTELESKFKKLGVVKFHGWIEADNREVIKFYENQEYEVRDLITISRTLRK